MPCRLIAGSRRSIAVLHIIRGNPGRTHTEISAIYGKTLALSFLDDLQRYGWLRSEYRRPPAGKRCRHWYIRDGVQIPEGELSPAD